MTRVLVVHCHPLPHCFVSAVRDRVVAGLEPARAEVRVTDLYAEGFEPALTDLDLDGGPGSLPDCSLRPYAQDLAWCDTLVLVYPTWWAAQPAMLKGWVDRVWVEGVAWVRTAEGGPAMPNLTNIRRLVAVTTHGSSKFVNAIEGEGGKRTLTRSLRAMCHPEVRTTWLAMYAVDSSTPRRRQAFLRKVEQRAAQLATQPRRPPR